MTLYDDLGIDKKASKKDIKDAYHKLAKKHHPDKKGGDNKTMQAINKAWSILKDDTKRLHYDNTGEEQQADNYMSTVMLMVYQILGDLISKNPTDINKELNGIKNRAEYNSTGTIKSLQKQKEKFEKFLSRIKKAPKDDIIYY